MSEKFFPKNGERMPVEYETCIYCGAEMPIEQAELVPAIGDDEAWERLAAYHHDGCEWIETRAHRETTE